MRKTSDALKALDLANPSLLARLVRALLRFVEVAEVVVGEGSVVVGDRRVVRVVVDQLAGRTEGKVSSALKGGSRRTSDSLGVLEQPLVVFEPLECLQPEHLCLPRHALNLSSHPPLRRIPQLLALIQLVYRLLEPARAKLKPNLAHMRDELRDLCRFSGLRGERRGAKEGHVGVDGETALELFEREEDGPVRGEVGVLGGFWCGRVRGR